MESQATVRDGFGIEVARVWVLVSKRSQQRILGGQGDSYRNVKVDLISVTFRRPSQLGQSGLHLAL